MAYKTEKKWKFSKFKTSLSLLNALKPTKIAENISQTLNDQSNMFVENVITQGAKYERILCEPAIFVVTPNLLRQILYSIK